MFRAGVTASPHVLRTINGAAAGVIALAGTVACWHCGPGRGESRDRFSSPWCGRPRLLTLVGPLSAQG
jgi:hypothetical protein